MKRFLSLFLLFFKIGLFTFGGGYAMISLVQSECVEKRNYLSDDEFLNMIAIAESTPGPIAINMATYIGKKSAGFWGALFATLGVVLPSFIILFVISLFLEDLLTYPLVQKAFKGISCAVAVIVIFAGIKLLKNFKKNVFYVLLFVLTAILLLLSELKVFTFSYLTVCLILFGGAIGLLFFTPKKKISPKYSPENANDHSETDENLPTKKKEEAK